MNTVTASASMSFMSGCNTCEYIGGPNKLAQHHAVTAGGTALFCCGWYWIWSISSCASLVTAQHREHALLTNTGITLDDMLNKSLNPIEHHTLPGIVCPTIDAWADAEWNRN